jgi:flagellar basal-body rod protein FlgF
VSSGFYVSLSGQFALETRLNSIANNVANMNTAGFRAEGIRFESVISRAGGTEVAYAGEAESYLSRKPGQLAHTGNLLDVAVDGEGWLALDTPAGTVYTRDGRMRTSAAGELLSMSGYPVLDRGGAPILIDPSAGAVVIADDGMITQGNRQIGALGLYLIPETARLSRYDNSGVIPDVAVEPVADAVAHGIRQGYVEGANVNPVQEMTRLIAVSRVFDSAAKAMQQQEDVAQEAIRALGPSS